MVNRILSFFGRKKFSNDVSHKDPDMKEVLKVYERFLSSRLDYKRNTSSIRGMLKKLPAIMLDKLERDAERYNKTILKHLVKKEKHFRRSEPI